MCTTVQNGGMSQERGTFQLGLEVSHSKHSHVAQNFRCKVAEEGNNEEEEGDRGGVRFAALWFS